MPENAAQKGSEPATAAEGVSESSVGSPARPSSGEGDVSVGVEVAKNAPRPTLPADTERMTEPLPTPFRFSIGIPFDHGNFTSLQGGIVWGDGGWLVSNGTLDYQAPGHMGQPEAVTEWLRRFFQVSDHQEVCGAHFRPGTGAQRDGHGLRCTCPDCLKWWSEGEPTDPAHHDGGDHVA
jgi:hypothetical protein